MPRKKNSATTPEANSIHISIHMTPSELEDQPRSVMPSRLVSSNTDDTPPSAKSAFLYLHKIKQVNFCARRQMRRYIRAFPSHYREQSLPFRVYLQY